MLAPFRHAAIPPSRRCPGRDFPVVTNRQWLSNAVLVADLTRPQALVERWRLVPVGQQGQWS